MPRPSYSSESSSIVSSTTASSSTISPTSSANTSTPLAPKCIPPIDATGVSSAAAAGAMPPPPSQQPRRTRKLQKRPPGQPRETTQMQGLTGRLRAWGSGGGTISAGAPFHGFSSELSRAGTLCGGGEGHRSGGAQIPSWNGEPE
ncbi:hypothetical protein MKZ38_003509 [Zalerion maritima]|uniref:Uncharacterized protein n=1 Tax=Zalerion maritima TaxID=339359 RepID=A0AAD5RWY4_9PEZI|nr:hypothetical protein MKZ38_003509 [Zalerion maritima]